MRMVLAVAVALGLSGCADVDFFGDSDTPNTAAPDTTGTASQPPGEAAPVQAAPPQVSSAQAAPEVAPARATTAAPTSTSAHCAALARQRAGDAAYSGEDPDTQQTVYERTYADCVAWDVRHAL